MDDSLYQTRVSNWRIGPPKSSLCNALVVRPGRPETRNQKPETFRQAPIFLLASCAATAEISTSAPGPTPAISLPPTIVENNTNVDEPLIQNCPDCGAAMDVSEVEPLSAVLCPTCGAPTTVSSLIDHFQLVDMLGHGGMGAVYKAHDTSLDRMVALKLLRKSSGTAEQIKQLETEAAITASINHPHVVRVFSTGTDHGRFYIAMELVEKGTLDRLIELQGRVAEAQVLEVGIQIASGLRAAQQAGLIHRDVKPGNILFSDAHTAKIVLFGQFSASGFQTASDGGVGETITLSPSNRSCRGVHIASRLERPHLGS